MLDPVGDLAAEASRGFCQMCRYADRPRSFDISARFAQGKHRDRDRGEIGDGSNPLGQASG
jgi:hypothetical protein